MKSCYDASNVNSKKLIEEEVKKQVWPKDNLNANDVNKFCLPDVPNKDIMGRHMKHDEKDALNSEVAGIAGKRDDKVTRITSTMSGEDIGRI